MTSAPGYDLLVIGGGINGAGIARDAVGRGYKVLLAEKDDLAQHTSSASTKLIHGGLRYLEHYEFGLVRKALAEREALLNIAPHIVRPLRFVLPVTPGMRPAWLIRLGLFLYDHLGKRKLLEGTGSLRLSLAAEGAALRAGLDRAFEYSDCWVDDSRLVVLNALDCAERGGDVRTRCAVTGLRREGGTWRAELTAANRPCETISARAVVNAAGPFVAEVAALHQAGRSTIRTRLVKGSHIVTRRLFDGAKAFTFQLPDGRVLFAIPYEKDFTLIGTTDVPWDDGQPAAIDEDEIAYLCEAVGHYLRQPISRDDIVWSYSGVRPLYDDQNASASKVTRDYVFDLDAAGGAAPILTILGGKITTYRLLAEDALQKLSEFLPRGGSAWTGTTPLPGGDFQVGGSAALVDELRAPRRWLAPAVAERLVLAYGTRAERALGGARDRAGLGVDFGGGLFEAELRYLIDEEFARSAEDILWRRSKLGLHMDPAQRCTLARWMAGRPSVQDTPPIARGESPAKSQTLNKRQYARGF